MDITLFHWRWRTLLESVFFRLRGIFWVSCVYYRHPSPRRVWRRGFEPRPTPSHFWRIGRVRIRAFVFRSLSFLSFGVLSFGVFRSVFSFGVCRSVFFVRCFLSRFRRNLNVMQKKLWGKIRQDSLDTVFFIIITSKKKGQSSPASRPEAAKRPPEASFQCSYDEKNSLQRVRGDFASLFLRHISISSLSLSL